jgi:hypothetical protein
LPQTGDIADDRLGHIIFNQVGQIELFLGGARRQQVECRFQAIAQIESLFDGA